MKIHDLFSGEALRRTKRGLTARLADENREIRQNPGFGFIWRHNAA
jgi:hypothetical protein